MPVPDVFFAWAVSTNILIHGSSVLEPNLITEKPDQKLLNIDGIQPGSPMSAGLREKSQIIFPHYVRICQKVFAASGITYV